MHMFTAQAYNSIVDSSLHISDFNDPDSAILLIGPKLTVAMSSLLILLNVS